MSGGEKPAGRPEQRDWYIDGRHAGREYSMGWMSNVNHAIEVRLISRISARRKVLMLDDALQRINLAMMRFDIR